MGRGLPSSLGLTALLFVAAATAATNPAGEIERGRYLVHAGGCITCHTADRDGAVPLAGGRELRTPFGTFWSPNITPDRATGIGRFTDDDLSRALRHGRRPDGSYYYPVFPYPSYAGLTDGDVRALGAYLRSIPPVSSAARPHELPWFLRWRGVMALWNLLNFRPGPFVPDPKRSPDWNRGAYLVRHLGHCGECHTPRNLLGGLRQDRELAGNPDGPEGEKVPGITPDKAGGIGTWNGADIETFLETGMTPTGDFAGSSMSAVIDDNTSQLTAADRRAIASYLEALPPIPAAKKPAR